MKEKILAKCKQYLERAEKIAEYLNSYVIFFKYFFRRILSDFLTYSGLSIFDFRKYMFKLILEYGELKWNKIYMQSFSKIRDFMVKNLALNDRTPKRVSYFGKWL